MKKHLLTLFTTVSITALSPLAFAQDHGHLNVGATGTNQNDQLAFESADNFATTSDYVKTLTHATSGAYAGYHQGNITLTAVASTEAHLGPFPNSPALGAWLFAQLVSVEGPAGGAFAFWDTGATNPTISLACGTTGTNTWLLSQNDGLPGTDPYGHIHGRRFTATRPGVYVVGFRAFDFSTNGVGGGPIHAPSDVLRIYFQAGDNIRGIDTDMAQTRIVFGARAGYTWQLQATPTLAPPDWQMVGLPVTGNDYFHEVIDETILEGDRLYRVMGAVLEP